MSDFKFTDMTESVIDKLNSQALKKADRIGNLILEQVLRGMAKGHSGRTYSRGGKTHTASAKGEYPAIDTGDLYNDLQVESSSTNGVATSSIGTTLEYAEILEGNPAGSGIRPWLSKAFFEIEGQIEDIANSGWDS